MTEAEQQEPEWYRELGVDGRRWPWWGWVPVAAALIGVFIWWALHPEGLPREDGQVSISVKAGQTAYVGLIGREVDGDPRDIDIRDVEFDTADTEAELEALICRDGAIGRLGTTDPSQFCRKVVEAKGTLTLGGGDQLIVAITGTETGQVTVDEIDISYRDGMQFGTSSTGPEIVVFVVG